ncbi:hypothetical protein M405DRAFT_830785 [Rhizopogon salebrosus TDB-379]|nr:hypothetical protein M405DRAFT_830785 [Rhizopogon salebrosus TDB-379]
MTAAAEGVAFSAEFVAVVVTEAGRSNSGEDYVGGTDIGRLASDNAHHSSGAACRIPSYSCFV